MNLNLNVLIPKTLKGGILMPIYLSVLDLAIASVRKENANYIYFTDIIKYIAAFERIFRIIKSIRISDRFVYT